MIRSTDVGEKDKLVALLTRDKGVIYAYASGVRSINSKRAAATTLLAYSSFVLKKRGDTYNITEAAPIKIFFGSGVDVVQLSLSQYFCEICRFLVPDGINSEEILRLMLNSIYFLVEEKRSPNIIKAITELRMISLSGYTPNLVACDGCGKFEDDVMYLKLDSGTLFCNDCRFGEYMSAVPLSVLKALRHIVYSKFEGLYSFDLPEQSAALLSEITEKYLIIQTERTFSTLEFYKSLS